MRFDEWARGARLRLGEYHPTRAAILDSVPADTEVITSLVDVQTVAGGIFTQGVDFYLITNRLLLHGVVAIAPVEGEQRVQYDLTLESFPLRQITALEHSQRALVHPTDEEFKSVLMDMWTIRFSPDSGIQDLTVPRYSDDRSGVTKNAVRDFCVTLLANLP